MGALLKEIEAYIVAPEESCSACQSIRLRSKSEKYLETFLEDGRLDISNNLCESYIRSFAIARRAWLFADAPKGVAANAVFYALIETTRANKLNV